MKKTSRIHPTKDYFTPQIYQHWIKIILISLFISSCSKEKKPDENLRTKFSWEPGISAPKYYPVGSCFVDFGNAGHSSRMPFDNGWGDKYGSVISGEKYKDIPSKVDITYNTAVENYTYKGSIQLDRKKLLQMFRKYSKQKYDMAYLVVGMAPGGWIRVWFQTLDQKIDDYVSIEVAKAQLKGHYDDTADERYKIKNFENWGKYYTYWQHYGIPYEAWANNEKEYYYDIKFVSKNKESKLDRSYVVSADGWYSSFYTEKQSDDINDINNNGYKGKIPVHLSVSWQDKTTDRYYDTNIVMPKMLKNLFDKTYQANGKYAYTNFIIELDNDKHHATVYLKTKDEIIKLLRFKGELSSKENQDFGDYMYAKEIEYFIK